MLRDQVAHTKHSAVRPPGLESPYNLEPLTTYALGQLPHLSRLCFPFPSTGADSPEMAEASPSPHTGEHPWPARGEGPSEGAQGSGLGTADSFLKIPCLQLQQVPVPPVVRVFVESQWTSIH